MPRAERLRRLLRRADHRAVLATAALLLAAIAAQAMLVYAFVAVEGLEEADRWMAYALAAQDPEAVGGGAAESRGPALPATLDRPLLRRLLDAQGRVVEAPDAWPPPERRLPTLSEGDERHLREFLRLRPGNYLTAGRTLADGGRIELALSLAPFHAEAHEVALALALLAGVSGLAALLVAALAMSWAFAPLRRATRLVEGIDARHLGQRLPTHGTGDPVDLHAEALNRVLADADATFDRLRAFSADVAHELRTPLNRLQNVAEVALRDGDERELKPALERVHAAAEELSRTVQSLLLLADFEDRRVETRSAALDLDAWLERTVAVYGPLFEERGVALRQLGRAGALACDRALLDRVLSNLLDNALLHGDACQRVEIRARHDEAGVTLEVDDAGPGIPVAMRERIFDRFTRLDRARSGPGTGLGLAVARACARAGGGDLRLGESQLGGACFVWTLPAAPPTARAAR